MSTYGRSGLSKVSHIVEDINGMSPRIFPIYMYDTFERLDIFPGLTQTLIKTWWG